MESCDGTRYEQLVWHWDLHVLTVTTASEGKGFSADGDWTYSRFVMPEP